MTLRRPYLQQTSARTSSFGIPGQNPGDTPVDVSTKLNNAIISIQNNNHSALIVDPGIFYLDPSNPIILPAPFTISGTRGRSIFKRLGSNFQTTRTFPIVGQAMFCVGNPANSNNRYLVQTGINATGSGLTANLTISAGQVVSAVIVAGGTGWKINDLCDFVVGGQTCSFKIATVSSYKGPALTMTINASSTGWTTVSNPVSMDHSVGSAVWDRILDPTTLGGDIRLYDLVFDGDYGGDLAGTHPVLTGSQIYRGVDIRGVSFSDVRGCDFKNFPNTGLNNFDCRRAIVFDNYFENNGWLGTNGSDKNAVSNAGIYVYNNNALLNTDDWLVSRNRCFATCDVPIEHHFITGKISENVIWDWAGLGIEGQVGATNGNIDASQEGLDNNGSIVIPADIEIVDNNLDGTRSLTANWTNVIVQSSYYNTTPVPNLPYGIDGISAAAGNEGIVQVRRNSVKNTIRRGIYAIQGRNGRCSVTDNQEYYVGAAGVPSITGNPINQIQGRYVEHLRNTIRGYEQRYASTLPDGGSRVLAASSICQFVGQIQQLDFGDDVDLIGFPSTYSFNIFAIAAVNWVKWRGGRYTRYWDNKIVDWNQQGGSGNNCHVQLLNISQIDFINLADNNTAPSYQTTPHVNIYTDSSTFLDFDQVIVDNVNYLTNSATQILNTTPIFYFNNKSLAAIPLVIFRQCVTPGFTLQQFDTGHQATAPTSLLTENNH